VPVAKVISDTRAPVKLWTADVESSALAQLRNVAQMPFVFGHVAAMPDVHTGIGATVGSVIATRDAIIPAAVGVDIGCGMIAARLSLDANHLDEKRLQRIFAQISRDVPVGRDQHDDDRARLDAALPFEAELDALTLKHPRLLKSFGKHSNWLLQMGTLGGGNHFIEVCVDEASRVWVMLHSGSRGIGNAIGTYFIELARRDVERSLIHLPDRDLAYLSEGSEHFDDYVRAVSWAQAYAATNRDEMLELVLAALARHLPPFDVTSEVVNCFAGETKVMTRRGVRPIAELAGGEHQLLTAGGQWVTAPVRSFGRQRVMEITLSRSGVTKIIRATANHRWLLHNVQRVPSEATTVRLRPRNRLRSSFPRMADNCVIDREAVARGFVFGDGSINGRAIANFCRSKDKALLSFFEGRKEPRTYGNVKRITGLPREWKTEMPSLDSPHSVLYGWLAGYFAADGDVEKTGRPTLASSKLENLEHVRALCTEIGVGTFGIRVRMRNGFGREPTALYLMGLMRGDLREDFFVMPSHRSRFIAGRNAVERRAWNVVSVVETDAVEEVYCAVVEGTHSFTLEDNILTSNCHHNYVAREHHYGEDVWVTRKGAIRARDGELGIVPGSMGARSYIVRGKGNAESFHSSAHGAGRKMSRSAATKSFTVGDLARQTEGVVCRKDPGVIDEIPGAYKDIDEVMANQSDLTEVVHTLKQVVCVKG
jgi:RNA-splicing ligase RtcB